MKLGLLNRKIPFLTKEDRQIGIYFSLDSINLVETQAKKVLNRLRIPVSIEQLNLNYLFTDELKVAALLKEQLKNSGFVANRISIGLPARELFIRYFELPLVPKKEIDSAIIYEAKRYVPLKIEDLFFDYQFQIVKSQSKIRILFVGLKKELINQYFSVFNQLNLKIIAIEPAHFSLARLIDLHNNDSCYAIIDVNFKEADITIVDNKFISFSRDLNMPPLNLSAKQDALQDANILIKFMNEIRISLDYYRRQSSSKSIDTIFYVSEKEFVGWIDNLAKGLGIKVKGIVISNLKDFSNIDNIESAKALAASLRGYIWAPSEINLIAKRSIGKKFKKVSLTPSILERVTESIFWRYNIRYTFIICLAVLIFSRIYYFQNVWALKNKIKIKKTEVGIYKIDYPYNSLQDLEAIKDRLTSEHQLLRERIDRRTFFTPLLDKIPYLIPEGVWFRNMSVAKDNTLLSMVISAKAYSEDETRISGLINKFISNLKKDDKFSKAFASIEMGKVSRHRQNDFVVADFNINCR